MSNKVETNFHEIFYYDESSPSCLRWKIKTGKVSVGDVAGSISKGCDYYRVRYKGKLYRCHRLVWLLHSGSIPEAMQIDHINGVTIDNVIHNLRVVTNKQNGQNVKKPSSNSSGVVGVVLDLNRNRWISQWCDMNGKGRRKVFNINKYGYDTAFSLACAYRLKMISDLNSSGADYSERHGTSNK